MSIYDLEQSENVDELLQLLDGSGSAAVRSRAAEALGEVGGDAEGAVTQALVETVVADPGDEVKVAAVDALDELGSEALERLLARLVDFEGSLDHGLPPAAYAAALEQDMPELRMAAANAIGRSSVAEALPALIDAFDDPDSHVRLRAVRAAARIGDDRATEPLRSLAVDAEPAIRREVAIALGEIGGERALEALLPLVEDDNRKVRLTAVKSLGEFGQCAPIEPLIECFAAEHAEVREAAAYAAIELLANAPNERSHEIRSGLVESLSGTHSEAVTGALVDLFETSTSAHQRRNAVWMLGRVAGDPDVTIETLVAALDDDDAQVRRFAATSLIELGTPAVETALLDALDSTFGPGRSMIVFTLGVVGSDAARERLLQLLDEVDTMEVQEQTLSALSHLGGT